MNRLAFDPYSPMHQRLIDGLMAGLAFWFSYQSLFEGHVLASSATQMWGLLFAISLGRVLVNEVLRCYHTIWRYVGLRDATTLASSYATFSMVLVVLRYTSPSAFLRIPLGVIVTEFLLSFTGAAAARVTRRVLYERTVRRSLASRSAAEALLIGAGRAGVNAANQLRAAGNLHPVAFLDDDPKKRGMFVVGLKVLGPVSILSPVVVKHRVQQVIVCISRPPREMLRRIWGECELLGVSVKIAPTLAEILERKTNIVNFRSVEMNDLLGRKPIEQPADDPAMIAAYAGKRILITGGRRLHWFRTGAAVVKSRARRAAVAGQG